VNLLLDLDGTLTDSGPGIVGSMQYALTKMGRKAPAESELRPFIGPPIRDSFTELLATADGSLVEQAVGFYRERYSTIGILENDVYPGIHEALRTLCGRGDKLFVATCKPEPYAKRIVEHFGLAQYILRTWGSELDGARSDKTTLIAHILEQEHLPKHDTVMVGDRSHDAIGARANGIVPVGVLWGYGSQEELKAAQCRVLLRTPSALAELAV
jgi:phosphoglycolate phosphatase